MSSSGATKTLLSCVLLMLLIVTHVSLTLRTARLDVPEEQRYLGSVLKNSVESLRNSRALKMEDIVDGAAQIWKDGVRHQKASLRGAEKP